MPVSHPLGRLRFALPFALAVAGAGCKAEREAPASVPVGGLAGPATIFSEVLDTLVPAALSRAKAAGAVVAVVEAGKVTLTKGYGMADKEHSRAMTDSAVIAVASVSKLVSSWGIMSLVQRGRLSLDQPIGRIVTEWAPPRSSFDRRGITIRRLWTHSAGLNLTAVPCFPADSARPTEVAVLNGTAGSLGPLRLVAAPGAGWSYSGGGYTLLQLAASHAAKQPFAEFMRTAILEPLRMRDSYFGPPREASARQYDEAGKALSPTQCIGDAASGFNTTARDMGKLLLEYGRAHRGQSLILPRAWLDTLAHPLIPVVTVVDGKPLDMGDSRMALGHFVHDGRDGRRMLFHSGGNPGVVAYLLVDLERDGGIFIAVNSDVVSSAAVVASVLAAWGMRNQVDPPTLF